MGKGLVQKRKPFTRNDRMKGTVSTLIFPDRLGRHSLSLLGARCLRQSIVRKNEKITFAELSALSSIGI
jgi:hypothetical protein